FTAVATGATNIAIVSGDGQQAAAGSELPLPLKVRVTGANPQPVVGVTVTFQPAPGSGGATPASATTDVNGEAVTRWTMPTTTGAKSLVGSISPSTAGARVRFARP